MNDLELKFQKEILRICNAAKTELKYNPSRFLQMVGEKGALAAVKQLINNPDAASGFTRLCLEGRLDLSVENCVCKKEFAELFSDEERNRCKERLEKVNEKVETWWL